MEAGSDARYLNDLISRMTGARVFLDNGANTALDDRVLDAEMNQDGSVRFAIASQS